MTGVDLAFVYQKPGKDAAEVLVTHWRESGRYIIGFCPVAQQPRTYRKDRVRSYVNGAEALLSDPFPEPPPVLSRGPEILFTGFPSVQRVALENRAQEAGMLVVKTVTQKLSYLCGGPNAGPAKLDKARDKGVWILSQPTFLMLLDTGELPDGEPEFL